LEELKFSISRDIVAKSLIGPDINYFIAYGNSVTLADLRLRISVLERSLDKNRYISSLQKHLHEAVKNNCKDEIDSLISSYVTTLINWGISKYFLYEQLHKIFFDKNKKIDSNEQFLDFFKAVSPMTHNYKVFFQVSPSVKLLRDSFKFFGMTMIETIDEELKNNFDEHEIKINPKFTLIEIKGIKRPDPYVARDIAEKRLETIRNTYQLYFHKSRIIWDNNALVIQACCSNKAIKVQHPINPMKKSFNYKSNDVAKKTNQIFQNIRLKGESFQKFNRIMELHSNCLHNATPENQIVNLWTILEAIVPSSSKKSKIQSICNAIIPILLLRHYDKLIVNLFNDLKRWDKAIITSLIEDILPEKQSLLSKFAVFLSDDENEEKREELYSQLEESHLLRSRTFKLHQILNSKEKILSCLEKHKTIVEWQLRRVYRTRNMIVHSGKSPNYINILIENTHDYIDQITTEIINMTISTYRIYNLNQAFEFGKVLYNELNKKIKESYSSKDYIFDIIREIELE